ncbi:transcription factor HES-5-like [Bufo bufo]|uniref:transcription factor HES-5-like n=1 Tax=Bufo bufo TaxID=8384 RepID=UPI001ABEBFE0|nr:transcription factor HES-5-like [Bufo bufo]
MAPNNKMEDSESNLGKDMRKLRKPVIEKMRRDRINSSIEQLRILLEKEFQRHQLPSKPEKADILEMTVTFLRQQLHHATKEVAPYKQASSPSMKDAEFVTQGRQLAAQIGFWMDPQKCRSANESVCHSLRSFNQGINKQGVQDYSPADLWRPW